MAGLQLVGLDDLWGPNFRPADVLPRVDSDGSTLTLCHNPDAVDLPSLADCRGWILSGHTHGGRAQAAPPTAADPAREESTFHVGRIRSRGRPLVVYQSRAWLRAARAVQCAAGNHRLSDGSVIRVGR